MADFQTDDFGVVDQYNSANRLTLDLSTWTGPRQLTINDPGTASVGLDPGVYVGHLAVLEADEGVVGNWNFLGTDCNVNDINSGSISYGLPVVVGSGATSPSHGYLMARVDSLAQAAAIGSTNLTTSVGGGCYRVSYYLEDTATQVGVATIQFQINYTDDIGARSRTGSALSLTAGGRDDGAFVCYLASGDITYQTNLVGVVGTATYALHVRVEALG